MLAKTSARGLSAILLIVSSILACRVECAERWPCFRGPTGMGLPKTTLACPNGGARQKTSAG